MVKNYFKIVIRNILKHKGYSFITISGLAIGMACCILIMIWVQDELSFDRFHENVDELYRVEQNQYHSTGTFHVNVTSFPAGPAYKAEIPEVVDATRYRFFGGLLLRYKEDSFYENNIYAVDPSFFRMFSFPLIKGHINTALTETYSIVITEKLADKYFPGEEPLGKVISVNNQYDFTVTGVIKEIPYNSSLNFDMLVPFEFLKILGFWNQSWESNSVTTFVQLQEEGSVKSVNEKMTQLWKKNTGASATDFVLAPITELRRYAHLGAAYYRHPIGQVHYVYIFSIIAAFVLLIACINFMNLSTARSANRAKEIALRKVTGASRKNIAGQFLAESMLFSFLALPPAFALIELLLPTFNALSGKELSLNILGNLPLLSGLIGITLLTGIIAGSYPALLLSAFQPVKILKGDLAAGSKRSSFRKILVVVQFTLSIILIIGTGVVYTQLDYMKNKKLGYDKEQLLYIHTRGDLGRAYEALKSELMNYPGIAGVTGTMGIPSHIGNTSGSADWNGKDPGQTVMVGYNYVDFDFIKTMKIEMAEGRAFSKEYSTDISEAFIVNEELLKLMGVESALGANFSFEGRNGKIVGVMKNFHHKSLREKIKPLVLMIEPNLIEFILIRLKPKNIPSSIDFLKTAWARLVPNYPLDYKFLDEDFDGMYRAEERIGSLSKYFSMIAIFIACFGLFGLASFTAEQRTKEIGIRKVLGASVLEILWLLTHEFTKLLLIANFIAWPVAYVAMNAWLQNFAYRIDMGYGVFIGAGAIALIIALSTVCSQAIKAALANPVEALRYE